MITTPDRIFSARTTMDQLARDDRLDHWHRLGCLAWVFAANDGHARLATGQAARELGLTVRQISDALDIARRRGWLDPTSTARCLVLPGCGGHSCEERHR